MGTSLEKRLAGQSGPYCMGSEVMLPDLCLVPQLYNAVRFGVDLSAFPNISSIHKELSKLDAFQAAHPDHQPDAPPS
eukprot:NODE_9466_length_368_cov_40.742947_g8561_i0.p2 GENE.NODE_9466_length_368_cov_40.742947_g8561_i0~~NODE_9466_length_368_cov_40.742947_g8561_i0.p2  ORF type:complete len:87 (-),score=22.69 NODE_9466_length_368_cov_40.742947_g8561_i0:107-337(-)